MVLSRYSNSLGIAYQIRDDIEDLVSSDDTDDLLMMRPTLPLAVLLERPHQVSSAKNHR